MGKSVPCPAPDCDREFGSENGKNSHVGQVHPSISGIQGTCETCGENFRYKPSQDRSYCSKECYSVEQEQRHCTFRLEKGGGYPTWWAGDYQARVHALVAIADGADPSKVFGRNEYHVDHINGCKLDNRPENLQVIDWSEHGKKSRPLNVKHGRMDKLRVVSNFIDETGMGIKDALEVAQI